MVKLLLEREAMIEIAEKVRDIVNAQSAQCSLFSVVRCLDYTLSSVSHLPCCLLSPIYH